MNLITAQRKFCSELAGKKYVHMPADEFTIAPKLGVDQQRFWADWNQLDPDNYLRDDGHFRLRAFAYLYFLPCAGEILPFPPTSYFQADELNSYAGGIQRNFSPMSESTLTNQFLMELIKFNFRQFPVAPNKTRQPWKLDVHQIRIVATPDEAGHPTPEGIHHDENDFVAIHLVSRSNVIGGLNTVYDNNRNPLASWTLHQPMDSLILWDTQVMHGVDPIHPRNPGEHAFRDVLLIGYSLDPDLQRPGFVGCD